MTIGERIKHRRLQLGMTVDDVAAELGKNRATVYRYENDEIKEMPTTVLEPLAAILKTTPADLMGWSEEPSEENFQLQSGRIFISYNFALQCMSRLGWTVEEPAHDNGFYSFSRGAISVKLSIDEFVDLQNKIEISGMNIIQDTFTSMLRDTLLPIAAHAEDGATLEEQMEDVGMMEESVKE